MKYLEKYNIYVDDDFVIYRMKKDGRLVQVKPSVSSKCGYEFICYAARKTVYVHRLIYEAFKGPIPEGMEIDHINSIRTDNRPDNLRVVTHKENMRNPLTLAKISASRNSAETRKKMSESLKGKPHPKKPSSEFGKKFRAHFGYSKSENVKQYLREYKWYLRHNHKCRWE